MKKVLIATAAAMLVSGLVSGAAFAQTPPGSAAGPSAPNSATQMAPATGAPGTGGNNMPGGAVTTPQAATRSTTNAPNSGVPGGAHVTGTESGGGSGGTGAGGATK